MNFVIYLSILTNLKNNRYNLIFVVIGQLIKIVYYKLIKIIINILDFIKVIINVIIKYYNLLNLIVINQRFFFILKFWIFF